MRPWGDLAKMGLLIGDKGAPMESVLIVDSQMLVAQDLAEAVRTLHPDARISIHVPATLARLGADVGFDIAFLANDLNRETGGLAPIRRLADTVVRYGAFGPMENAATDTLLWPVADAALRRLIDRVAAASSPCQRPDRPETPTGDRARQQRVERREPGQGAAWPGQDTADRTHTDPGP